jgi:hypothetical protein
MTILGLGVAIYVGMNWALMPVPQRMVGLFFVGLVMHLWEEGRFPRGFVELITEHLNFTASSRHFGEIVTAAYVLVIAFVPLFFPQVIFLTMAAMMLGIMEAIMHLAMIRMFRLKHFYSPGLATALVLLLPISVYTFAYVIRHHLAQPISWLFAFLYMLFGLIIAQQIVIRASGVKYSKFLRNVREAPEGSAAQRLLPRRGADGAARGGRPGSLGRGRGRFDRLVGKRRERQRVKEAAAAQKDRERRQHAVDKAQATFDEAEREHAERAAAIEAERAAVEKRSQTEDARWDKERARLQAALKRARE